MNLSEVMINDSNGSMLVDFARLTADRLVHDGLTRSQIRNIFTEVRKIEALWGSDTEQAARRLNMLKPKLDYQTARHNTVKGLRDVLIPAIDTINQSTSDTERDKRFERFVDLFEAILAYHRALGGKN